MWFEAVHKKLDSDNMSFRVQRIFMGLLERLITFKERILADGSLTLLGGEGWGGSEGGGGRGCMARAL